MELTESQKAAIAKASAWYKAKSTPVFTITGYAGTGKTTIVQHMIGELNISDNTAFVTYTGKASLILNKMNCDATTIHKLIYQPVTQKTRLGNTMVIFRKRTRLSPYIQLIVVDEISMVSHEILKDLLSFKIPIIALGDPGQLPPVNGSENSYMEKPDIFLTEIHRQAKDNPIIYLSMLARQQQEIPYGRHGDNVWVVSRSDIDEKALLAADQILCGYNTTRKTLNNKLRRIKGLDHSPMAVAGDKVICLRNNWEITCEDYPLINGMIGEVADIRASRLLPNTCHIDFRPDFLESCYENVLSDTRHFLNIPKPKYEQDRNKNKPNEFDFGYAITCHKSQGSGFGKVLLFEETLDRDTHHRWLYTGITRAIDKLIVAR